MNRDMWARIMKSFHAEITAAGRKAVLVIDNASCHQSDTTLAGLTVVFLPPNSTLLIQPFDKGVIHSSKSNYLRRLTHRLLTYMETGRPYEELSGAIDAATAIVMARDALDNVTSATIRNSFTKCGPRKWCFFYKTTWTAN